MIATITKDVPKTALCAIQPMFNHLRTTTNESLKESTWTRLRPSDFDWALHPGGAAILQGAQQALRLDDNHMRASKNIYRNYGNSSSPTVLIVLDELRKLGPGRDHVVSASFGPGMMIEMCVMKRCREVDMVPPLPVKKGLHERHPMWFGMQSKLVRMMKWFATTKQVSKAKQESTLR